MNDDLRNRFKRSYADESIPQRYTRPKPIGQPEILRPVHQPAQPSIKSTEKPSVANQSPELKTRHKKRRTKLKIVLPAIILLVAALSVAGFFLLRKNPPATTNTPLSNQSQKNYFPASFLATGISMPVYYPVNLPAGYSVSGFKVLDQNVLYYIVTDNNGVQYYLTTEPIPFNFDIAAFKAKFTQPEQYNVAVGTAIVGQTGVNLIGSVLTKQNVWVIINCTNLTAAARANMEVISRALQPSGLQS